MIPQTYSKLNDPEARKMEKLLGLKTMMMFGIYGITGNRIGENR